MRTFYYQSVLRTAAKLFQRCASGTNEGSIHLPSGTFLNFTAAMFVPGTAPFIRMRTEATPPLQLRELAVSAQVLLEALSRYFIHGLHV